jgi:Mandelate racemase / muconate lactonizing enzyme, N-terminal domain
LHFPPGQIFYDAIHEFGAASGAVVLRLQTNAGITGWATSSFGTMEGGLVLQSILQNEVKQVLVGQDPAFPKRLRSDLWKALEYSGVQGVAQLAIASAEVAIWHILRKCAQVPAYKMLGAFADKIPTYSMCSWTTLTATTCPSSRKSSMTRLRRYLPFPVLGNDFSRSLYKPGPTYTNRAMSFPAAALTAGCGKFAWLSRTVSYNFAVCCFHLAKPRSAWESRTPPSNSGCIAGS